MSRALLASGTLIAAAFAGIAILGAITVALYKAHESGLPPVSATFRLWTGAPANASVHPLDNAAVHARDSFLEDHLDTALDAGASRETDRLRVEQMRATVRDLAGVPDPTLFVEWNGKVVQVAFSGLP